MAPRAHAKHSPHAALRALVALILALVATDAWAVVLYKLTDAEGRIAYVDQMPQGFRGEVKRLEIDTTRPAVTAAAPANREPARGESEYERIIRAHPTPDAAERKVRQARAKLEAARNALQEAQENSSAEDWIYFGPRNPAGMRRTPRPEYLARLEQLEHAVQKAEAELRAAERGW